ncbi:hypothetical protein F511_34900 [Dorcoceras hygrometricum]|uniref:histone acetyltransferase n=1 Tax=Dorcoceras hygrometricum TaxID=472368 RepID=A0A2Z7AXS0_9LAMI|nr:hypothetical protein F511_34900 [Dorcoceras hygrometricum]
MDNDLSTLTRLPARPNKRSYQEFLSCRQLPNIGSNHQVSSGLLNNSGIYGVNVNELAYSSTIDRGRILDGRNNRPDFIADRENLLSGGSASMECRNPETFMLQPQTMQHGSHNTLYEFSSQTIPVGSLPRPKTTLGVSLDSFGSRPPCSFSVPTTGPEIIKPDFSRNIHCLRHTSRSIRIKDIQPVHKGQNIEDPVDNWSLWAVVKRPKQLSEMRCRQLATVNSERFSSPQNSGKDLRMHNGVSGNQNMGNVDTSFCYENNCLADKQQTGNCHTDLSGIESRKKDVGISLIDFFTAEQIKVHLRSLKQRNNLNDDEESVENTSKQAFGENTCRLCEMDEIKLAAPIMFCASCEARIKCNLSYYWTEDETGIRQCFCTRCFKGSHRNIPFKGLSISKEKLRKAKNTQEDDEAWVKCDMCECWQHQICALYNSKQDLEGEVRYICPFCRLAELNAMEHVSNPLANGAQDLPRTVLSDHIEQRLFRSLERERKQRAESLGKSPEEVPGASDLTVRVVLSVNKQVKVSPKFLDILDEKYPTEFAYKSKVILLFQKIEGVDVCLFALYVQEFGSDCEQPNQRSIYISYLDSVKYFRPEIKTVAGDALRTFVYQEVMLGYLSYCKRRGFTTCYIWACPPSKGDDYIFYCHPETQKMSKNLRAWYKKFLQKAKEENVVVECTNFYDCFFTASGTDNHKITAARLPYFVGDYWSGATEDIIRDMEKDLEEKSVRKVKKAIANRSLRSTGHSDSSVEATKDVQVMQQLGDAIKPCKEDFFVIRLQFTCMNCHEAIITGNRWTCNQCCYHLCSRCHDVIKIPPEAKTCPKQHLLHQIAVALPQNTDDKDIILDNEFFESRLSFLSFCQKNHYQFDTLRRSKHSSMMILYHIQNMTELTIGTICSICQKHTTVEWHCGICSEFLVCTTCYKKEGDGCHIHKLIRHSTKANLRTMSKEMQQQRGLETKAILDLLLHANCCPMSKLESCSYPRCQDIKNLFFHNLGCARRVAGGCQTCKKIWFLLCLHARNCRDSSCKFPRCSHIKNFKDKIAAESEVKRRAAAAKENPLQQRSAI